MSYVFRLFEERFDLVRSPICGLLVLTPEDVDLAAVRADGKILRVRRPSGATAGPAATRVGLPEDLVERVQTPVYGKAPGASVQVGDHVVDDVAVIVREGGIDPVRDLGQQARDRTLVRHPRRGVE